MPSVPAVTSRLACQLALGLLLAAPSAPAGTFAVSGTTLQLTLGANETCAITAGASNYTFALTGGTWSGTDGADTVGNGTASLSAVKASFAAVTVDDAGASAAVTFNNSGANPYTSSFTVTLDDPTAGAITFDGAALFAGNAALSASTSRNIIVNSGASVTTASGSLTLSANQPAVITVGSFTGITVSGTVGSTSGTVTVSGRGGADGGQGIAISAAGNIGGSTTGPVNVTGVGGDAAGMGVYILGANSRITSGGGNLTVNGTGGGASGTAASNMGVYMQSGGSITGTGSANVSVTGTGGASNGNQNVGVWAWDPNSGIFSGTGTVTITATGGGAGSSIQNYGIYCDQNAGYFGGGDLTITATSGRGTASTSTALQLGGNGRIGTTGAGNIRLVADSMSLVSGTVNAEGRAVTLVPKTSGYTIGLGAADGPGVLGLTDAELDKVTCGTMSIGDTSTVAINVTGAITQPGKTVNLTAQSITYSGGSVSGGSVNQSTPVDIAVEQPAGTIIADGKTVAFGSAVLGATTDLVFTVRNPGFGSGSANDLTGLGITIDGANAGEFSVVASPTAPVPIGGSTTFTVRFAPTSIGTKTAALHIASNVPSSENPYDINLTATGTGPDISVEQPVGTVIADGSTKNLGSLLAGSTADFVFTVKNPGTAALAISGVTFDGPNAGEFSVLAAPASSVAIGGSTTFTVRFAPTGPGSKTAALHLASNVMGTRNPYDINLTATAVAPDISVESPAGTTIADGGTKSFGGIAVGSTGDVVFTLRNPGTSALSVSGITFDGTNAGEFSVVNAPAATIAAGGSTTFTVRCAPTSRGGKTAALHIASDVAGAKNPYDITLVAFGASTTPLGGTKTVGPTGDYAALTFAILDIQTAGLAGPLALELQPAYLSSAETFPLVLTGLPTTATNTVTVRPQAGATALSISSADTTAATVDLNGAQFFTFDGRPGGAGTAKQLTIENTSTSGVALRFINEASNNAIKFVALKGVNSSASSGVVLFSTTTGANGNDNNAIDHCDIGDGASTPTNGLYSLGSTGTVAQANSGNTVSDCNLFNFYASTATDSAGLRLDGGNTDWTITGNSFYQTATRAGIDATSNPARAIFINNTAGNNFTVTGNFIGGDSSGAAVTTQKWTAGGTAVAYRFVGIALNVGATTASSVQGNTIANIAWTTNSNVSTPGNGPLTGIYVAAGNVNIGTVTGNAIGSGVGTGSITVTTAGSGGASFGIGSASSGTVAIAKNTIGSITTNGIDNSISASLTGISVTAGANTISNNTVGSLTTANSLNAATSSASGTGQQVVGILSSSSTGANITGNTVANLNNDYAGTSTTGHVRGIAATAGGNAITGNVVRNLSTTGQNANSAAAQSVFGITVSSTTAGQTVSQNTVHSLANTAASAAVSVTGIYFAAGTSTGHVIARNFVHSLAVSSSSTTSVVNGMQFILGAFTARNNLVRLGLQADGTSTAGASIVRGIYDNGTTAGRNFYYNSVWLGGTQTVGAASTFAFTGITGVSNTRDYRNNIFVNARGNSGSTSKHYAAQYGGTTANPTGLTASNNLFLASGTGGVLGLYNSVDRTTLALWQSATGKDSNSLSPTPPFPLFVAPAGTSDTVDLHLQVGSPAIGAGLALASVTDDFDGQARPATAPAIGGDQPLIAPVFLSATGVTFTIGSTGTFTVAASGAPAPTLALTDGTLPQGVNFTPSSGLLAGTPAAGTAGSYPLVFTASNGVSPAATQNFTLAINTPPTAGPLTLGTPRDTSAVVPADRFLLLGADSDGDPLSLSAVASSSAQGGTVSLASGNVTYAPPAGFTGSDAFSYTLSDGRGGLATGTVSVTVSPPVTGNSSNITSVTMTPTGPQIRAAGIPNRAYTVEATGSMAGEWVVLATVTASRTGVITFTDTTQPLPPSRFYRVR